MHNTIGTRPRRTVACAGLLLGLLFGGCSGSSTGSDGASELTTADGGSTAAPDTIVDAPAITSPPATIPPATIPPPTTAAAPPPTTVRATTTTAASPPPTTIARPTPTTARATTTTARPTTTTAAAPRSAQSTGQCHSSYQGTCIPPDVPDADCASGSGDGPWYVQESDIGVVGPDVFDLDRDGDGVGCES